MSHITDVKLRVRDLDALESCLPSRGLELVRGKKNFKWFGKFVGDTNPNLTAAQRAAFGQCEHAIRLKDAQAGDYEIGVVKALDGSDGFDLLLDTWAQNRKGGLLDCAGGPGLDGIRREYAAATTERQALLELAHQGFTVEREDLPGNRIRMRLVKW